MKLNINEIILQEIEFFTNGLNKEELIGVLHESTTLVNSLIKLDKENYDINNQTTTENWQYFLSSLRQVINTDPFIDKALVVNAKLYVVKKFTQLEFQLPQDIENVLKFELKKYFHLLVTTDPDEFITELFNLPFEFVSLVIRYVSKVVDPKVAEKIIPSEELAIEFYKYCLTVKEKYIKNTNDVSLGVTNNFNLNDARLLLDTKAFYSYNALNVGALEYLIRLTNDSNAQENLYGHFGQDTIDYMREQAIQHPSYIQYLKKIKAEELLPFFKSDGTQNEERDKTFDDFVKQIFEPQDVIPKVEPQDQQVTAEPTDLNITPPADDAAGTTPPAPDANAAPATPEATPPEENNDQFLPA